MGKIFEFKMNNSKTVITQVKELQLILRNLRVEDMTINESFQVIEII